MLRTPFSAMWMGGVLANIGLGALHRIDREYPSVFGHLLKLRVLLMEPVRSALWMATWRAELWTARCARSLEGRAA
jgi:hypothetical protein